MLACVALLSPALVQASARESWTSVRSKNFLLVGNAAEGDMRQLAACLEQFHEAFSRVLAREFFDAGATQTTIVLFRDDASYHPFKPKSIEQPDDVAGAFQPGTDVDYITLPFSQRGVQSPYSVAIHEYVHLLVRNRLRGAPLWFKEGFAEYYSTAEVLKDKSITLGKPIPSHVQTLRTAGTLPLRNLLEADSYSPYYRERDKRRLFYAQSWALVHYLLSARGAQGAQQLSRFVELLASGSTPLEESLREAFGTSLKALESDLWSYAQLTHWPEQTRSFDERLEFEAGARARALSEAETQSYLGDLLLHDDRPEEALVYLERAAALDPSLAIAQSSLGLLRLKENRFAEAEKHLQKALASDGQNALAHFYYAETLSRGGREADSSVKGYLETTAAIRASLRRAIELSPNFVESYRLLASVELERGGKLEEAAGLLRHALKLSPRREDVSLLLAEVSFKQGDLAAARRVSETLLRAGVHPCSRGEAEKLRARIRAREEAVAAAAAALAAAASEVAAQAVEPLEPEAEWRAVQPCDMPQPGPQRKPVRFEGEQKCGQLVRVECETKEIMLWVDTGERLLKLRGEALNRIRFVTYTPDVSRQMTCGLREPSNSVLVTYRPAKELASKFDGEVVAVEFVPKEWEH